MHSRKQGVDPARASDYVLHAMIFTLLHELGHAIIGELDLGVTGGEEDAVDDFAGWPCSRGRQAGQLLDGAEAMLDMGALSRGQLPFHDEHSFSAQRVYNLLCLGYGRQPQELQILVDRGQLPRQRAVRCAGRGGGVHGLGARGGGRRAQGGEGGRKEAHGNSGSPSAFLCGTRVSGAVVIVAIQG
jgi:hypothetical protein